MIITRKKVFILLWPLTLPVVTLWFTGVCLCLADLLLGPQRPFLERAQQLLISLLPLSTHLPLYFENLVETWMCFFFPLTFNVRAVYTPVSLLLLVLSAVAWVWKPCKLSFAGTLFVSCVLFGPPAMLVLLAIYSSH